MILFSQFLNSSWVFSSVCTACPHHSYLAFGLPRTLCYPPQPLNSLAFSSLPGLPSHPSGLWVCLCVTRGWHWTCPAAGTLCSTEGPRLCLMTNHTRKWATSPASPSFWGEWKCSQEASWDSHGHHVAEWPYSSTCSCCEFASLIFYELLSVFNLFSNYPKTNSYQQDCINAFL